MEDMESERRVVLRRRKITKTQQNVIIGIATVAGLGLVGKLLSILRSPKLKPKKKKDEDVETLESVLSGDESDKSSLPLQAQVQRRKLANLENDEPDHEVENRRKTRRSKYADSFSEIIPEEDITKDGEMYVNQEPVGRRERRDSSDRGGNNEKEREARDAKDAGYDANTLTARSRDRNSLTRRSRQLPLSESGFNIKGVSHFNAEDGGKYHNDDGEKHDHEDSGRYYHKDGERDSSEDGERNYNEDRVRYDNKDGERDRSKDGERSHSEDSEDGRTHDNEDEHSSHGPGKRSSKELTKKESTKKQSFIKELAITSSGLEKLPPLTQKKSRRTSSAESKKGRKSKEGGDEKGEKTRKSRTLPEVGADKEVIFDEAGRWESINGYKVLKATTSKIPTFAEAMHKLEADGTMTSLNDNVHLVREFEREKAETARAKSIWDGKVYTKKKNIEGSEGYLQIKSSVVSSVAGAEHTPEGVKVREVVKRSTLLPIPSGDESEVHSSVYNVQKTDKGLKVEEVLTRTKLLPAKGDFTFSDQQLLRKQAGNLSAFRNFRNLRNFRGFEKPTRQDIERILPQLLRLAAVVIIVLSFITMLFSRRTAEVPMPTGPSVPVYSETVSVAVTNP